MLVVDDNPDNLRVLEGVVKHAQCRVRLALSGEMALRAIALQKPDIILLDVRMPDLDGYEVCRRLKADPDTCDIPVIFISALQEVEDKVNGFRAGGVDYVVKPFQAEEVISRIRIHLELATARRALREMNTDLEYRVQERTRELQAANANLTLRAMQERALSEIMALSLAKTEMREYLNHAIALLNKRLDWSGAPSRNLVFLADAHDPNAQMLLVAGTGLTPEDRHRCRHIQLGQCRCLRAIFSGQPAFHDCSVRDCDTLGQLSVHEHGRYWIPLLDQERVLGAMVHYLSDGNAEEELDKSFLQRLGDMLALGVARRLADERVVYLAFHDELTGLPNRRLFENRLEMELNRSQRQGGGGAILFLDLDHFKNVNDVLGHAVGDDLLQQVAARLSEDVRKEDTLARWGGDEFLLLLSDVGANVLDITQNVVRVANKLRQSLEQPFIVGDHEIRAGASIGVALFPAEGVSAQDLIKRADTAMYQAKQSGRNNTHFFEHSMQHQALRVLDMERDLRRAVANGEFILHFQPQTDFQGRLVGMEALIRWPKPEGGLVCPADFIPIAEDTGLILPIGEWALRDATTRFAALLRRHALPGEISLAVNISPRQFRDPAFLAIIESVLRDSGLPPERLKLEVTEGLLMGNVDQTVEMMQHLSVQRIRFSIDDFGTGYSSLAYLKRLPIQQLKIDQSFVRDVHNDPLDAAIIAAILSLAHNLEIETIAEGVETMEELAFLHGAGCRYFQGYYFSRPLPWDDMVQMLMRGGIGPAH
ncbi:two-component system response regulator [Methylogaea oryzae]|uniref:EAL domain-containing protein n=1 Tax=Methylogaea oryzae TaxID=1295382 RepID=A0A8D4VND4_9GAMM|nr:EAL domain-containing protein [Methylogaea oryzae]BBL70687.1 hypothetical protein MoryE10_12930 [Methylogaea oryzae]